MQQQDAPSFDKRMEFYICAAVYKQGIRGKGYSQDPVYLVALTNFDMPQFEPQLVNSVFLMEGKTHRLFGKRIGMYFISLAQVNEDWDECGNELERRL